MSKQDQSLSKTNSAELGLGIAAVERDTGLSKDLLRVWERRYGFPQPVRDALGERTYPQEQLRRLRLIKRLLDAGQRPNRVVALPESDLLEQLQLLQAPSALAREGRPAQAADHAALDPHLAPLLEHRPQEFLERLQGELLRRGLKPFIGELLAPLVQRVGELWAQGLLQIHEEHVFSQLVQQLLHRAIAQMAGGPATRPRVLLSTLPGEEHGLGLLMVHALLTAEGCNCLSLGLQTPVSELVQACIRHRADALVLSFSRYASAALVEEGVAPLRATLPSGCELWLGGSAAVLRRPTLQRQTGLRVSTDLAALSAWVEDWCRTDA
jgi:DNA-binding transcriptional MerR regulator/methylmalonyl-CoA mutase cobalamin-binding subunit